MTGDLTLASGDLFVDVGGGPLPYLGAVHASRAFRHTIDQMGLGASQTPPCRIVDGGGKVVGWISYNGRVWAGEGYCANAVPIFDPYATEEIAA